MLLAVHTLGSAVSAQAATDPVAASYQVWHMEEGWQQGGVTSLLQDRDGYLWLGTYHGLVRFDGVRVTIFDATTPGLHNGLVTSLYEDGQGQLWIGHETGQLTRRSEGVFEPVALGTNWQGGPILAITSDEKDDVWVMNRNGALLRVRDRLRLETSDGPPLARNNSLARSRQGKLWLVANGALFSVENGRLVPFQLADSTGSDYYEEVCAARDGGLWLFGNERLRKWRDGRWVKEVRGGPAAASTVTFLRETRSGGLLVGTLKEGLYLLDSDNLPLHFSRANGLSHDWVRAAIEDREGNYWLGTARGFEGLRPRQVRMLAPPDNWQGCGVLSFSVLHDGSAWVGTEGAGVYHFADDRWTSFSSPNVISNSFVWSVLAAKSGELLVGTWGAGLLTLHGDRFSCDAPLCDLPPAVPCLYESRNGDLWIGTPSGLFCRRAGKLLAVATKEQLVLPDVRAITESADGTLWFGMSGGGLGSCREGNLKQVRKADGLGTDFVVSLYADTDGTLWIGSPDSGLIRLRNGKFASMGLEQGLPSLIISHIVDDGAGNLWLGTHAGILRAAKSDLQRCADGLAKSAGFLAYGNAAGLSSQICLGGFQPGACRGADGRLWFPTAKGLAVLDPANVVKNTLPPPVVIEELIAGGQSIRLPASPGEKPSDIHTPPGAQRFEIRYTALSLTAPERVRFKYRLQGLESEWIDAGSRRVAPYSYLPPGEYTFQVRACNNDEVWNEKGASLSFTVPPRFWQTWWFRSVWLLAGCGLVAVGAMWMGRWRLRRKLEQLDRQRALERERARIARDIHDDLGASLTRITLLSQSVRAELPAGQPAADIDKIYETARDLTRAMDEIVWAVNPKHDSLDSLVTYLGRFAQHFLSAAGVRCRLDVPMNLPAWQLTSEVRHNVFLAFKEALHNVVKHAAATEARISLELQPAGFALVLADNGRGFRLNTSDPAASPTTDTTRAAAGNGLANMRKRMEEIGGLCALDTAPGEGTRVKLVVTIRP